MLRENNYSIVQRKITLSILHEIFNTKVMGMRRQSLSEEATENGQSKGRLSRLLQCRKCCQIVALSSEFEYIYSIDLRELLHIGY